VKAEEARPGEGREDAHDGDDLSDLPPGDRKKRLARLVGRRRVGSSGTVTYGAA
jgi:hypothetical protein